jgi:flagellar hook-length control protein FliK
MISKLMQLITGKVTVEPRTETGKSQDAAESNDRNNAELLQGQVNVNLSFGDALLSLMNAQTVTSNSVASNNSQTESNKKVFNAATIKESNSPQVISISKEEDAIINSKSIQISQGEGFNSNDILSASHTTDKNDLRQADIIKPSYSIDVQGGDSKSYLSEFAIPFSQISSNHKNDFNKNNVSNQNKNISVDKPLHLGNSINTANERFDEIQSLPTGNINYKKTKDNKDSLISDRSIKDQIKIASVNAVESVPDLEALRFQKPDFNFEPTIIDVPHQEIEQNRNTKKNLLFSSNPQIVSDMRSKTKELENISFMKSSDINKSIYNSVANRNIESNESVEIENLSKNLQFVHEPLAPAHRGENVFPQILQSGSKSQGIASLRIMQQVIEGKAEPQDIPVKSDDSKVLNSEASKKNNMLNKVQDEGIEKKELKDNGNDSGNMKNQENESSQPSGLKPAVEKVTQKIELLFDKKISDVRHTFDIQSKPTANTIENISSKSNAVVSSETGEIDHSVVDQLVKSVTLQVKNNFSEMKVTLKPESLGEVVLRVQMEDGKINAQIDASNQATRNILEASSLSLRQELRSNGIDIQRIEIFSFGQTFAQHSRDGNAARQKNSFRKNSGDENIEDIQSSKTYGYNTIEYLM